MNGLKYCPDCQRELPLAHFTKNRRSTDGLAFYCRGCANLRQEISRRKRLGPPKIRWAAPGIPDGMKWCPECRSIKPLDEYPRNRSQRSGIGSYCKPCHNRIVYENKERRGGNRNYHLRRRYGITVDDFNRMFAEQGGLCAICEEAKAEHVDHDHHTGRVRGLLCFNCNGALGQFRDRTDLMVKAVAYLEPELYGAPLAAGATLSTHLYIGPPLDPRAPQPAAR